MADESGQTQADSAEMSLFDHLTELRTRILYSALATALCASVAFMFTEPLFSLLVDPFSAGFSGRDLIGTGPADAIFLRFKVACFAGLIFALPVIFTQVWLFVAPGLLPHEKRMALPFIFTTTLLFALGLLFCYELILPPTFEFFASQYEVLGVTPQIRVTEHISIMMQLLLAFGISFELPVLAFLLGRFGVITHQSLIRAFRYAVVIIFIVAAVLTPPDPISQLLMAGPLIALYGISIVVVRYTHRREIQKEGSTEAAPSTTAG
ncbi:MAG: twin-arginine translocase subunit TatC [Bdellovibrionota bacterium]|nr:MAG: twin-arginine translocase subunit TatC [Bdellovibrionota bacterium]